MTKDEILKAFDQLSAKEQQAVRTEISDQAAASCCSVEEMQEHMKSMMKMMQSSGKPMECGQQMMVMCQEMMHKAGEGSSR